MDFKNNLFLFPANIGDSIDGDEGALELNCALGKDLLQIDLRAHVIFAFAIEAAFGRGLEVVEMGKPVFPAPYLDVGKAFEAPIDFFWLGGGGVDQVIFVAA